MAVEIPQRKGEAVVIDTDEHPRASTTLEGLSKLKPVVKADGTVTAGMLQVLTMVQQLC